ncbi:uncharacterized protein [Primulina eburnea]|uniref:uncharacterized protein n=1 Tax=Primulina eburnea TaxID=1245227 RepID=UPI003C6BF0D2
MSFEASNSIPGTEIDNPLKRNSKDVGWEFADLVDPTNMDKLKCKLCGKITSGGIYRMKQHISNIKGNVAPCKKSSDEDKVKCKNAIEEARTKKKQKNTNEMMVREEVFLDEYEEVEGSSKKTTQQKNIIDALWKQRTHSVQQYVSRWVYESGIPFHAIDNDSFKRFVEAVGQFGPGYCPPSQYLLREPLLKEEVERTKILLKKQEEEWILNDCSILTDAWTDRKRRSIMNLCVNCKEGTTFLSSREASDEAHTGNYIFEYVDKCIEEVGAQSVVQVVTDNASNNMAAKDLLKEKRPHIFWTSCATHTLNLMLQKIGNQSKFKGVIEKAKCFTIFIYAHHKTLSMMRKFTKKRDIVRPGVTRFATAFLTLQSLMEKKNELRAMVASEEWNVCEHSKSVKGNMSYNTALSASFWNGVSFCLKVFAPLVKVLRLVDGDNNMGFLYGELLRARDEIKMTFKNQELHYRPIIDIIDEKSRNRLDSPLHLAAYLLNPYYSFNDPSIGSEEVATNGFFTCVESFFPDDIDSQSEVVNVEFLKYINKEVGWWHLYGNGVPKLQKMAKRILSLTTSSSGCERNWRTFEGIHTKKKRNRLDTGRLNNLVYVQFNAKIINKRRRQEEKEVDVLLTTEATMAQGWIVDGGDEDAETNVEDVRELHEEEFVSDEEKEDAMDFEFESDTEKVL